MSHELGSIPFIKKRRAVQNRRNLYAKGERVDCVRLRSPVCEDWYGSMCQVTLLMLTRKLQTKTTLLGEVVFNLGTWSWFAEVV